MRTEGQRSEDSSLVGSCFACAIGIRSGGKELHLLSSFLETKMVQYGIAITDSAQNF